MAAEESNPCVFGWIEGFSFLGKVGFGLPASFRALFLRAAAVPKFSASPVESLARVHNHKSERARLSASSLVTCILEDGGY